MDFSVRFQATRLAGQQGACQPGPPGPWHCQGLLRGVTSEGGQPAEGSWWPTGGSSESSAHALRWIKRKRCEAGGGGGVAWWREKADAMGRSGQEACPAGGGTWKNPCVHAESYAWKTSCPRRRGGGQAVVCLLPPRLCSSCTLCCCWWCWCCCGALRGASGAWFPAVNRGDVLSRTAVAFLAARCAGQKGLMLRGAVGDAGARGLVEEDEGDSPLEPLRDRAGTGRGTELEPGGVGGGRRAANAIASWLSLGRGGTARRCQAGDEGNVGTGQRKGVVVPSSIPLGQPEGCPQLLEILGSGAGEEWEMGAVGLHPLPLTLHPVTRSPAGWWAVGAGLCHVGAGYGPFGGRAVPGQRWLLTLDARCRCFHAPQPRQTKALALLCSPKTYRLCPASTSPGAGIRWWQCRVGVPSGFSAGPVANATRVLALHAPVALPSPRARQSVIPPAWFPSGPGAWSRPFPAWLSPRAGCGRGH